MPYKDYQTGLRKARERYWNRPVIRAKRREIALRNYDPILNHARHLKYMYGMLIGEYDKLFQQQNGCCAICGKPHEPKGRFKHMGVDHCHLTGRIRGLLCFKCNHQLGWFETRRIRIEEYLR